MRKYYKDYESEEVTTNGKIENKVRYNGDYYEYHLSIKEYQKLRKIVLATIVAGMALFFLAGVQNNPGSFCFYVLLPYICILLGLIYLVFGYFSMPRKLQKMEFATYDKSFLKLKFSLVGMVAASSTSVIGDIVFMIRNAKDIVMGKEVIFLILNVLLLILSVITLIYHNRIVCEKVNP